MQQVIAVLAFLMLLVGSALALRDVFRSWWVGSSEASTSSGAADSNQAAPRSQTGREYTYREEYANTARFSPTSSPRSRSHWDPFHARHQAPGDTGVYRARSRETAEGPPSWDPYAEEQSRTHRVRAARHRRANASMPNYYVLLGVERTASDVEIERAYRKRAAEVHPDRFYNDPERRAQAEEEMRRLNDAMRLLRDPVRRARYDSML